MGKFKTLFVAASLVFLFSCKTAKDEKSNLDAMPETYQESRNLPKLPESSVIPQVVSRGNNYIHYKAAFRQYSYNHEDLIWFCKQHSKQQLPHASYIFRSDLVCTSIAIQGSASSNIDETIATAAMSGHSISSYANNSLGNEGIGDGGKYLNPNITFAAKEFPLVINSDSAGTQYCKAKTKNENAKIKTYQRKNTRLDILKGSAVEVDDRGGLSLVYVKENETIGSISCNDAQ